MLYIVIYYIHYNNFSMIFIIAMESLFILLLLFTLSMRKWSFKKKKGSIHPQICSQVEKQLL